MAQTYPDSQNLFTLGRAAIFPAGSWEISVFRPQIADSFEMGAFPPPVPAAGDTCYISDHTDIGIGMNAAASDPASGIGIRAASSPPARSTANACRRGTLAETSAPAVSGSGTFVTAYPERSVFGMK